MARRWDDDRQKDEIPEISVRAPLPIDCSRTERFGGCGDLTTVRYQNYTRISRRSVRPSSTSLMTDPAGPGGTLAVRTNCKHHLQAPPASTTRRATCPPASGRCVYYALPVHRLPLPDLPRRRQKSAGGEGVQTQKKGQVGACLLHWTTPAFEVAQRTCYHGSLYIRNTIAMPSFESWP